MIKQYSIEHCATEHYSNLVMTAFMTTFFSLAILLGEGQTAWGHGDDHHSESRHSESSLPANLSAQLDEFEKVLVPITWRCFELIESYGLKKLSEAEFEALYAQEKARSLEVLERFRRVDTSKLYRGHLEYRYWNFRMNLGMREEAEARDELERLWRRHFLMFGIRTHSYAAAVRRYPFLRDIWRRLAEYYSHRGPIENAFKLYEFALRANPDDVEVIETLATAVLLFRSKHDAQKFYRLKSEQETFDKSIELYRRAILLDPTSYERRRALAESFYLMPPYRKERDRIEVAIQAWLDAMALAPDEDTLDDARVHLARFHIYAKDYDEAQIYLERVQTERFLSSKIKLLQRIAHENTR